MINQHSNLAKQPRTLDNQVRVSTPENISFQYEISGPMRRLFAYLADVLITLSVFGIICIVFLIAAALIAGTTANTGFGSLIPMFAEMAGLIVFVLAFISMWFYGAYMETNYNGQTLGKMAANIRTISSNGSAIDGTQATLRNFFRLLDVFPIISLGLIFGPEVGYIPFLPIFSLGLIVMAISPKFQRIGDFVSGTIVVTEDKKWVHGLAKFQDPRVSELAELLPDSYVTPPSMARALAEYVDRRRVLPSQRVNEIASFLANPLLLHFELPRDTNSDLLLCSLYYKTFMNKQDSGTSQMSAIEKLAASQAALSVSPATGDAS